ncbi:MAG: hypothetical protein OIF48_12135 [Silicimonas sp.]|nr:hypothetical protein [Silicimonas sp.]
MSVLLKLSFGAGAVVLAGCGGGGGDGDTITSWTGAAVTANGTNILSTEKTSGQEGQPSGRIRVATAAGTFASTGGPDGSGIYRGANGATAQRVQDNLISDTYAHAVPLVVTQNVGGTQSVSTGVLGPASSTALLQAAALGGSATYRGEAAIITDNALGTVRHRSGDTRVTADFAGGTVGVTMEGITVPANGVSATVDRVEITGATISGATFSGGTVTATLGGSDALATITGGGVGTNTTEGVFFGADGAGTQPAEVGGVALVEGNTGSLSATYVAK